MGRAEKGCIYCSFWRSMLWKDWSVHLTSKILGFTSNIIFLELKEGRKEAASVRIYRWVVSAAILIERSHSFGLASQVRWILNIHINQIGRPTMTRHKSNWYCLSSFYIRSVRALVEWEQAQLLQAPIQRTVYKLVLAILWIRVTFKVNCSHLCSKIISANACLLNYIVFNRQYKC